MSSTEVSHTSGPNLSESFQGSVLVVDDNPLILSVLNSLLSSEKYQVYTAANGKEALDLLMRKELDLVICDVMMPEMDGFELHKCIRAKSELAHVPFIFLTALGENVDIDHGKEQGVDDYITKPFEAKSLLSLVKGKVSRSRSIRQSNEERYDSYRKRVVHVLSHEFRTPLVAINTGSEILLDHKTKLDSSKVTSLLEAIHRGGQRLERLVTDFMLLQQIEAGIAEKLFESRGGVCNLVPLVTNFIEHERSELESIGFQISTKQMVEEAPVNVYEPHIIDILGRLLSNARKFKGTELFIEVVLYNQDGSAIVEVRDRGIGMNVERVREAIDMFGQLDREKLEQQGGGLGLAIASKYAHINKGRLDFESTLGKGTVVTLTLPLNK